MNITPKQIKSQYDRIKRDNWLPWFEEAAKKANTTTAHFLAIGSRESNLKNIRGDFRAGKYHGYGPLQVDIGTDAEFAKNWTPADPSPGIRRGGEIYEAKVDQVIEGQGKTLTVKGKKFVGRYVELDDVRRIATAAYNSGLWAYFHFSNHAHVDSSTTGKDYSRDVYDRALVFASLLEADGETDAYAKEIRLQGKYATEEERAKVKESLVTESVTETPRVEEPKAPEVTTQEPEPPAAIQAPKPEVTPVAPPASSITTKIAAGASALGPALAATGLKIGGIEFKTGGLVAIAAVIIVGMVIGAWIWNQSQERALQRQKLSMENLASDNKGNVIAAGTRV